jgi:rubredoxin
MIDRDKVFDAFRNCITEPKCRDCPWEQCEQFNQKKVEIPVTLALDVIELLKEQEPKQGHWLDYYGDDKCSVCGATYSDLFPDYQNTHYCPNCGAKMIEQAVK